jgi:PAS domain S-box-containing protein
MSAAGGFDATLVVVSIVVAVFASYTALELAGRARAAVGHGRRVWLLAAAAAMGGGIWSMHFVGMLAFTAPMPVTYEPGLTLLSLLIAVAITYAGFVVVVPHRTSRRRIFAGGVLMGTGIVAMHYVGMAAMSLAGEISYIASRVALSVVVAVGVATAALRLALASTSRLQRWAGACAMGAAVSGMHYAGMAAARFAPAAHAVHAASSGVHQEHLAVAIAAVTMAILLLALAAASYDRSVAAHEAATLRESERQFREFYNRMPAAMQSVDRHGRLLDVNDYWIELLGYRRETVLGRPLGDFLTPQAAAKVAAAWPRLLASNELRQLEIRCRKESGATLDVLVSARIERDAAGEVRRGLMVLNDITQRKRLEEQLVHAQKMEAVGLLTGGIAHDFNNLLTVIAGNLALLEMRAGDDPALRHLIQAASRAAERSERLTQQLLAFSRRQRLEPEEFDLNERIEEIAEMLQSTLGRRIAIGLQLGPQLGRCFADPGQVEAAIVNLAINARDAMPEGGKLTIATAYRTLLQHESDEIPPGDYSMLEIADTGHGMPPDVLERALEPFYTTKEVGKGSGLGLSMVYGFARQSGGGFEIESAPGSGTRVRLFLPRSSGRAVSQRMQSAVRGVEARRSAASSAG